MNRQGEDNPRERQPRVRSADLINQYFDALQDAIVRGDEPVEVTPEIGAFTIAVRALIHQGREALPPVHRLAEELGGVEAAREPAPDADAMDSERLRQLPGEMLLQALDRILEEDGAETAPTLPGAMTDDEVRTVARDIWHPRVREPGANA